MTSLHLRMVVAFLLVIILTIVPLPAFLSGVRPPWVLLFFIYLIFYRPDFFNLGMLFILGIMMDVLLSTVMGEHVFALLAATWVATSKQRRFSHSPLGHQLIGVGLISFIYQLVLFCIDGFFGYSTPFLQVIMVTILSMIVWPWLRLFADEAFMPFKAEF